MSLFDTNNNSFGKSPSFGGGGFPSFDEWLKIRNAPPDLPTPRDSPSIQPPSPRGDKPPNLGQSISALEQIIGRIPQGGKMTSQDFALGDVLEKARREERRKAWRDATIASGGTVTTLPVAGAWGAGGKMVGYD
jgi:hypothetical protein